MSGSIHQPALHSGRSQAVFENRFRKGLIAGANAELFAHRAFRVEGYRRRYDAVGIAGMNRPICSSMEYYCANAARSTGGRARVGAVWKSAITAHGGEGGYDVIG